MNRARKFFRRFCLTEARMVTLHAPLSGVAFDDEHQIRIPAGHYQVLGDDSRDPRRVLLMNTQTEELYAVRWNQL